MYTLWLFCFLMTAATKSVAHIYVICINLIVAVSQRITIWDSVIRIWKEVSIYIRWYTLMKDTYIYTCVCVSMLTLTCIFIRCIREHTRRLSCDSRSTGNSNGSLQQPTHHPSLYAPRTAHRAATDRIRANLVSFFQGAGGKCILWLRRPFVIRYVVWSNVWIFGSKFTHYT